MIASGWFRLRVVPLQKICSLNFKFLLIFTFIIIIFTFIIIFFYFLFFLLFLFWFLAPAGEQASSQSIECHKPAHFYDKFKVACSADGNTQGLCKQCTRTGTQGETFMCCKRSPNDLPRYCCTRQRSDYVELFCSIIKHPDQTLMSLRTCLPNGKSQTGRYHQEDNDIDFRLFLGLIISLKINT